MPNVYAGTEPEVSEFYDRVEQKHDQVVAAFGSPIPPPYVFQEYPKAVKKQVAGHPQPVEAVVFNKDEETAFYADAIQPETHAEPEHKD